MRCPWWLRNWHDTDEPGAEPGPLDLPVSVPEALARVEWALRGLEDWSLGAVDPADAVVTATRRTRLCRFTDDVTVRLDPTAGGTRVRVRSQSRLGVVDLGQNRRNVRELFAALKADATGSPSGR